MTTNNKIIFLFLFLFFNHKYINGKIQQENTCSYCSCKIEEYIKQIKELESLLAVYRKDNISLMEKLAHALESAAKEIASAYEKHYTHLIKCTSRGR